MTEQVRFPGKVCLQQRVLPDYRAPFFDALAERCQGGLSVLAGPPRPEEAIQPAGALAVARLSPAENRSLFRGAASLWTQSGLLEWLAREWPDVLVVEANPRYLSNLTARRWMHAGGKPVVGWGLGAVPASGLRAWFRRGYLDGFDGLIAYSTLGAAQYRALGFPAERVFVAPNAATRPPRQMPARDSLRGRRLRLFFVGRLQERRRLDLLLEACGAIEPQPEVRIAGDGPDRARLEAIAGRVLPEAVFLGDLRGESLRAAFEQADLFVLPGTGGLALQQALAAGLPVIAAEGDGSQQDMVTPENGWLVRPGDLAHLRAALEQALALDERGLQAMGAASFRLAQTRFNLDAMADAFVAALRATTRRRT
ncbi:MAG: glycosyltransferase [Chloroflexi bacterium]|nr:glycosyltransferase [Chloroflexota bacterium]